MKIVILNASPRRGGFTHQLLDAFMSECPANAYTTVYNMYDENISPCVDCGFCKENGKCFMNDNEKILGDIFSSDLIIFAAPVYNYSFPAPMKAFLDRLQPYFYKEKTAPIRKGYLLATCGNSGKYSVETLEKQSRIAFSELSAEMCGKIVITNTDKKTALQDDDLCKVKELAKEFFLKAF